MEALSSIIGMNSPRRDQSKRKTPCESLSSQGNEGSDLIITAKEIQERGYTWTAEPEPPAKCSYCGDKLYQEGVVLPIANKVMAWLDQERCTCDQAVVYWDAYDKEKAEVEAQEAKKVEDARKMERVQKLQKGSGIRKRFLQRTFENAVVDKENAQVFKNSKLYAENFKDFKETGQGLFYSGGFGTGKTYFAVAIALELIKRGTPVICMTAIDLLAEIRRTYDKDRNISEYEILKIYKEVDLLVIDDLGKENATEWAVGMLYDIINDRYENCLPVIITTNYSDEDLVNRLARKSNDETAGAIMSRLHEMTMGISLNGKDRRKDI